MFCLTIMIMISILWFETFLNVLFPTPGTVSKGNTTSSDMNTINTSASSASKATYFSLADAIPETTTNPFYTDDDQPQPWKPYETIPQPPDFSYVVQLKPAVSSSPAVGLQKRRQSFAKIPYNSKNRFSPIQQPDKNSKRRSQSS